MCPYFFHVHLSNDTVYAVAAPIEVLGIEYHDGAAFNLWLIGFVENRILPRISEIGSGDRLIYVDVGPGGSTSEQISSYVPVAETKIFDHDQALEYFYFPPMWVESKPIKTDGSIDFPKMSERVFNTVLPKSGLKIAVTRDGKFTVDFSDWTPGKLTPTEAASFSDKKILKKHAKVKGPRFAVLNTLQVLLRNACYQARMPIHTPMRVTPQRTHNKKNLDSGGGGSARAALGLDTARSLHGFRIDIAPQISDWRIVDRNVLPAISLAVLEKTCRDLDEVLAMPIEQGLTRLALYEQAGTAFEENDFSLCLVQAWSATESLISEIWEKHVKGKQRKLEDGGDLLTKSREDCLFGPTFTTSMVTELLLVEKILPDKLYAAIKPVRSARNKWIHGLVSPDLDTAKAALEILEELLELVCNIQVKIHHAPMAL